jgi:hypothetical protein
LQGFARIDERIEIFFLCDEEILFFSVFDAAFEFELGGKVLRDGGGGHFLGVEVGAQSVDKSFVVGALVDLFLDGRHVFQDLLQVLLLDVPLNLLHAAYKVYLVQ